MSAGLFFSGGKDSAFCLQVCDDITHLITTFDWETGRVPIQGLRLSVIRAQAEHLGLKLVEVPLPPNADNRAWIRGIRRAIDGLDLTSLAFGDLYLEDIREFRERTLAGSGLEIRFPLWGRDTRAMATRMLDAGIRATICSVNPHALPATFLGEDWDEDLLGRLPAGVDPCGENGEFHTLVTEAPGMAALKVTQAGFLESMGHAIMDLAPEH